MAERKLFGTDGVRGVAGEFLTPELATNLGRAATLNLEAARPQVLVIRDTRESGPMLEQALAAGIAAAGGDALLGGVLPTPAASVLARRLNLDLAAVVSASHNPYRDNGIKFLGGDGMKLDDDAEVAIEARLGEGNRDQAAPGREAEEAAPVVGQIGRVRTLEGALDDYLRELQTAFPLELSGTKVILDCANGAAYRAAPAIFSRLGAEIEVIGDEPDGRNINESCGATHPEPLAERVAKSDASIGFAFDGDADRLIAVDGKGTIRDGDELIGLAARHLAEQGELDGGVAVTVMTNLGFHNAMREDGIEIAQTPVGDRAVIAELRERGWKLGGEQSGHIVWTDFTPTGDGVASALLILRALGERLLEDVSVFERLPQRLENVEVADREAIAGADELWRAVEAENAELEGRGRVLVRPSGTEPLLRIMVEAPSEDECEQICSRLAGLVEKELG